MNEINLSADIDSGVIAEMCSELTGADVKSIVCDALVKAFHRAHNEITKSDLPQIDNDNGFKLNLNVKNDYEDVLAMQQKLQSSIVIEKHDLLSSVESVKKTINKNEREKLKRM